MRTNPATASVSSFLAAAGLLSLLSAALILPSCGPVASADDPPATGGIKVAVINAYWATDTAFWVRIMLKNDGKVPATVPKDPFTIDGRDGTVYEVTEPTPNASANVRLNPKQEHLVVVACEVGSQKDPNGYKLVMGGKSKIPLKVTQPGAKK